MSAHLRVELVFDADCPHIDQARSVLRSALEELGTGDASWTEWDRASANTPREYRHYGSPTILVNGRDVAAGSVAPVEADGSTCRLYVDDSGGVSGAPSTALILAAIQELSSGDQ